MPFAMTADMWLRGGRGAPEQLSFRVVLNLLTVTDLVSLHCIEHFLAPMFFNSTFNPFVMCITYDGDATLLRLLGCRPGSGSGRFR